MGYGASTKSVYPAVKSAAKRVSNFIPNRSDVARLPVMARRQSVRTSTEGNNPVKAIGTLRGGSRIK